ncbi:MAG TPA: hypothetical protein DC049_05165, partial [Spirochaetia bacterium]|nr:hypothetical protein [Spirochaetia bacterium]
MTIKENNGKIIARITLQADNDFFYLYAEITDSDLLPPGRDISRSDSLLLYFFHPDANNNGLADGDIQIQILPGDGVKIKSAVHISVITSGKATELDAVNCQSAGRKAVFYSAAGQSGSAGWQVEAKIPVKPLLSLINQNTRAVYFNFATADLRANDFRILYACGAVEHNNISRNFIKGILFQSAVFLAENNTPNKNINLPIDLGSGAENLLIPDIYLPEKL